jgi:hypothetical protein
VVNQFVLLLSQSNGWFQECCHHMNLTGDCRFSPMIRIRGCWFSPTVRGVMFCLH